MNKEQLNALATEVLDRIRNSQDAFQLEKAAALARFYNGAMLDARLAGVL